jgi:Sigma-70, region 4.
LNEGIKHLSRSRLEKLIHEWILSERDREILKRRFIDGIKFDELSEEFELSVRQIKRIVYRSEDILRSKIARK